MYLRLILIALLVYLVARLVRQMTVAPDSDGNRKDSNERRVSRDVGDYVDYEEVDDEEGRK